MTQDSTVLLNNLTRKLSYRKDDCAMHPLYGCPENFESDYAHGYFSWFLNGLLFRLIIWMRVPNFKVRSFTHSWDNRGYRVLKKHWPVSGYAHAPLSPKFLISFCSDGPCECISQIWSPYSFICSRDNTDWSLGVYLGEDEAVGVGDRWYHSKERWWVPIGLR